MPTTFIPANFDFHGGYLTYQGKFVARFKYLQPRRSATAFQRFLCARFTPEEYFARLAAGEAPLPIAESKGFILPGRAHLRASAAT